jgi:hypothetical protein
MINRAEQLLETRSAKDARNVKAELAALKARQLLGGDNLVTNQTTEGSYATTVAAGATVVLIINLYAETKQLYLSELKVAYFLDVDADSNHAWPYGVSINPDDLHVSPAYCDLAYSDEFGVGNKAYMIVMKNNSGSSRDLYVHFNALFVAQTLSAI